MDRAALATERSDGVGSVDVVGMPYPLFTTLCEALPDVSFVPRAISPERWHPGDASLVVLYDAPGMSRAAIAAIAAVVPTIVVSEQPSSERALAALESGADGYIDATLGPIPLRAALAGVLRGELAFPRELIGRYMRLDKIRADTATLTPRQHEILALIRQGATDRQIAEATGLRTNNVQKNVARLRRRLGARNRAAAVAALPRTTDRS